MTLLCVKEWGGMNEKKVEIIWAAALIVFNALMPTTTKKGSK